MSYRPVDGLISEAFISHLVDSYYSNFMSIALHFRVHQLGAVQGYHSNSARDLCTSMLLVTVALHRVPPRYFTASQKCNLPLSPELVLASVVALHRRPLPYRLPFHWSVHLLISLYSQMHCLLSASRMYKPMNICTLGLILARTNSFKLIGHILPATSRFTYCLPYFHKYKSRTDTSYRVTPRLRCTRIAGIRHYCKCFTPLLSVRQYLLHQNHLCMPTLCLCECFGSCSSEAASVLYVCTSSIVKDAAQHTIRNNQFYHVYMRGRRCSAPCTWP